MKDYCFTIAGLHILLRTPHEITVSESLQPFLLASHPKADCTIELRPCTQLPACSGAGVWHGLEYYDCQPGSLRVFHCNAPQEAAFAVTEHLENGNIEICVLPDYLSYFTGTAGIFNRIGMETLLLQHERLLLHASLITYKGKTLAFAGPSGVGKSTQAALWQRCLGAQILNGDRAALGKVRDGWYGYGCPYAGTSGIYKNDGGPLAAILLLKQAEENRLHRLTAAEAFPHIYQELSIHRWQKSFVAAATDLCLQLLSQTPIYLLECRPEESAVRLAEKGLFP